MNCFHRRLGERYADLCDWVDYRPDADFRPLLGLPVLVAFGWTMGGAIGLELALGFAFFVAVFAVFVGFASVIAWIVGQAVTDVLSTVHLPEMPKVPARSARAPFA